MIFEKLKYFDGLELTEVFLDFQKIMKRKSYSKKDILHQEGKICHHLFLVEKGVARAFYYKDGKDITAHFSLENEVVTAIDSFIQRKRSRYTIELLEDAQVISISHQDLHQLLQEKPPYEKYVRIFLEQVYIELAERIEDLLFHNAKQRYDKLIQKSPALLQRIDLQYIASYLGITQETLSRIRRQA